MSTVQIWNRRNGQLEEMDRYRGSRPGGLEHNPGGTGASNEDGPQNHW